MKEFTIYSDGGSRNNPGQAAIGFLIYDGSGNLRQKCGKKIGIATNNEAEYSALLEALKELEKLTSLPKETNINCFLDSQLVANQINGLFRVKEKRLIPFIEKFREYKNKFNSIAVSLIPREKNTEADLMVNMALDS